MMFKKPYNYRYAKVYKKYNKSGNIKINLCITLDAIGSSPAYMYIVGDIILNESSGEEMIVSKIINTNTILIINKHRGINNTIKNYGNPGDKLLIYKDNKIFK